MLYMIAAGTKIDMNRSERFSKQIDDIYRNPFVKEKKQPHTAEEIKQHILHKIEEAREWI